LIAHSATGKSYHIPYRLEILNPDNVVLCEGCVLFKDTPVIDQIIGLMTYEKTNQERTLLETTNFFRTTAAYDSDPVLTEIRKAKQEKYSQARIERNDNSPERSFQDFGLGILNDEPFHQEAVAFRPQTTASIQEAISIHTGIPFYSVQSLVSSPIQLDQLIDGTGSTALLLQSR
jgi:hypothetical protein